MVNQRIKAKIDAALRRGLQIAPPAPSASQTSPAPRPISSPAQLANVRCIVDALKHGEKTLTIREIAERHGLSDSTVRREFQGRLGCFRIRTKLVVTETLYTQWLTDIVMRRAS
ncbi:MAG: helix-turn-helix domain-containing protein [Bryobacteraceae bacterium]